MQGFSREGRMKVLAYFWLSISKDPRAKNNLLYLKSTMTSIEIEKARKMIQHHLDNHTDEQVDNRGEEKEV